MSATTGALMRRGMEYMQVKEVRIDIPPWLTATLVITAIAYLFLSFSIEYTFGRVIPTLIMIESPEDITFDPLSTEDVDTSMLKDAEHQIPRTRKYITSNFRQTIKLLQSKGGFRARYRGLAMFIVNRMAIHATEGFLMHIAYLHFLGITGVLAPVICALLPLAWTHIVISEPSPKAWYQRLPAARMWKKIAGPTALLAIVQQASVMLPTGLAMQLGLDLIPDEVANLPREQQRAFVAKAFGVFGLWLVLAFLLVFPAKVALTRIQASLLQETEETIVPFDRSFGGKVIPEIVGGTGRVGILDAWKSFNWAARVRLIKAYVKVIAMQAGLTVLFAGLVVCQILMIGGIHKVIVPVSRGH